MQFTTFKKTFNPSPQPTDTQVSIKKVKEVPVTIHAMVRKKPGPVFNQ